CARDWEWFAYW
nr:immunoglobulin heavy chain junction region [Mus musculus]MBK4189880.1 immunoglobulin heavy chain junction region [Mus musculus]